MTDLILLQTRWGQMFALANDFYITGSLKKGEYGKEEIDLLRSIVQPGWTVIDAGANIGAFALPLALACAPGPLYAFEPQQRVFQLLCANFAVNSFKNAVTYPFALGEETGVGRIPAIDYSRIGNFGAASLGSGGVLVPIESIDSFELQNCHLIKIDVEGFEAEVIRGARRTIGRCRPILYVENDRQGKQQELIDLINSLDYFQFWHVCPLGEAFPEIGSVNMLCIPSEAPIKIEGFEKINPLDWKTPADLVQ